MKDVLVVYKKSLFELYSKSTDENVFDYINNQGLDAKAIKESHDVQKLTLEHVVSELERRNIQFDMIYRADLKEITNKELVIVVGGDGTFLEVSHYVNNDKIPLFGVNSDPKRNFNDVLTGSVGYYMACSKYNFNSIFNNLNSIQKYKLNRFQLSINDSVLPELVLNDVLISHSCPAATSRFTFNFEGVKKEYKNSGILISTPSGSTAWMYEEGGNVVPLSDDSFQIHPIGKRKREYLFAKELDVHSLTRQGMIYIDGGHLGYDFSLCSTLKIRNGTPLLVLGDLSEKREKYI
ncbi:MAG: NAD(+)/NADH kinase [Candidatus Woesearchaeota archaeon]|jgi:NAD+ kinase